MSSNHVFIPRLTSRIVEESAIDKTRKVVYLEHKRILKVCKQRRESVSQKTQGLDSSMDKTLQMQKRRRVEAVIGRGKDELCCLS